ncbi:putative kinesin [Ilyonectria robusta]
MDTYALGSRPPRPTSRHSFEIAIICALTLEADAVGALFDFHWDDDGSPFDKAPGDPNAYSTGAIDRHNVVLAHMPGMGKANATTVANNCRISFPNIKLALVVGVCRVIPFGPSDEEIILGDVIISDGVIQYDLGRQLPNYFMRKDTLLDSLGRPNLEIRAMLAKLKGLRGRKMLHSRMAGYLKILRLEPALNAKYPGTAYDKLFEASYHHIGDKECEKLGCEGNLVPRRRLQMDQNSLEPAIHFGLIASGDSVMKSGEGRNAIAVAEGVIAFEMEGAGVWDTFPCVVIRGACDYADSHKSKTWQRYSAATAAACMKAFLSYWVPSLPTVSQWSHTTPITLDEVLALLSEAKVQELHSTHKIQESAQRLQDNDASILHMKNLFVPFLRLLLLHYGLPMQMLQMLDDRLEENGDTMQKIINSDKKIASELKEEGKDIQESLSKLKSARDLIQEYDDNSTETSIGQEEQQHIITKIADAHQLQDEFTKLKEQLPKVLEQCARLQQTVEQLESQRTLTNDRVRILEEQLREAERVRLENEQKTVWQKIKAWALWLLTCGSED